MDYKAEIDDLKLKCNARSDHIRLNEQKIGKWADEITSMKENNKKLEEKLDSHIDDFQIALRKIIYEHINMQGDEYGEDIQELLRMMDGFRKELPGSEKEETPHEIKEKAYLGFTCPKCGEEIDMTESYHHFLDRLENAINRDFLKKLNALEKKFLLDTSRGDSIEVEAVGYSDIEKLIKKLEEDRKTTVSRSVNNSKKEGEN